MMMGSQTWHNWDEYRDADICNHVKHLPVNQLSEIPKEKEWDSDPFDRYLLVEYTLFLWQRL